MLQRIIDLFRKKQSPVVVPTLAEREITQAQERLASKFYKAHNKMAAEGRYDLEKQCPASWKHTQ